MSRPVLIRALIAIPALLIAGVIFVFFSWFYTVTQLRIASRWGVFPSAEEGMQALAAQSYRGIQSINILYAGPNSKDGGFPYVWFVIAEVRARQRAGEAAPAGRQICDVPGSFFLHTRDGWVHVSEGAFPGVIGIWMNAFGLAGAGQRTPAVKWAPDQPARFCLSG